MPTSENKYILMKYDIKIIILLLLLFIVFSCKKEDEYRGSYDIKGKVRFDNGEDTKNSKLYLDKNGNHIGIAKVDFLKGGSIFSKTTT